MCIGPLHFYYTLSRAKEILRGGEGVFSWISRGHPKGHFHLRFPYMFFALSLQYCALLSLTLSFLTLRLRPPYNFAPSLQLHFPYIEPNEGNFKLMWNGPELTNG